MNDVKKETIPKTFEEWRAELTDEQAIEALWERLELWNYQVIVPKITDWDSAING